MGKDLLNAPYATKWFLLNLISVQIVASHSKWVRLTLGQNLKMEHHVL